MTILRIVPHGLTAGRALLGLTLPAVPGPLLPWLVLVGSLTDLLDGWLARRLHVAGGFGTILDPAADKVFLAGVLVVALRDHWLAPETLAALASREIVVLGGSLGLLLARRIRLLWRIGPSPLGKLTTLLQFAYLTAVIWRQDPLWPALAVVALVSLAAGIDYLIRGWRLLQEHRTGAVRP